ncbi:MAG TPA: hypothetical protein VG742_22955 [Dongiaceae bacterium]|nr:hypothetical protein [Dongiaceae bacterium]
MTGLMTRFAFDGWVFLAHLALPGLFGALEFGALTAFDGFLGFPAALFDTAGLGEAPGGFVIFAGRSAVAFAFVLLMGHFRLLSGEG